MSFISHFKNRIKTIRYLEAQLDTAKENLLIVERWYTEEAEKNRILKQDIKRLQGYRYE